MIYYWLSRSMDELEPSARCEVLGDLLRYVVELTGRNDAQ
jgi:hypothetical protein